MRDLLLLARSDSGQLGNSPIELPIREVLERAVAGVPGTGDRAPIGLDVEDEALCVRSNEPELVRLFANLLDNAIRHTPPDGPIRVAACGDGSRVLIPVSDTGVRIGAEHLPHLGERFYRAEASRAAGRRERPGPLDLPAVLPGHGG